MAGAMLLYRLGAPDLSAQADDEAATGKLATTMELISLVNKLYRQGRESYEI